MCERCDTSHIQEQIPLQSVDGQDEADIRLHPTVDLAGLQYKITLVG